MARGSKREEEGEGEDKENGDVEGSRRVPDLSRQLSCIRPSSATPIIQK